MEDHQNRTFIIDNSINCSCIGYFEACSTMVQLIKILAGGWVFSEQVVAAKINTNNVEKSPKL